MAISPEAREDAHGEQSPKVIGLLALNSNGELRQQEMIPLGYSFQVGSDQYVKLRFATEKTATGFRIREPEVLEIIGTDEHVKMQGRAQVIYSIASATIMGEILDYVEWGGIPGVSASSPINYGETLCYVRYAGSKFGNTLHDAIALHGTHGVYQPAEVVQSVQEALNRTALPDTYKGRTPVAIGPQKRMKLAGFYRHIPNYKDLEYEADAQLVVMMGRGSEPSLSGFAVTQADDGVIRTHEMMQYFWRGTRKERDPAYINAEGISRWMAILYGNSTQTLHSPKQFDVLSENLINAVSTPNKNRLRNYDSQLRELQRAGYDLQAVPDEGVVQNVNNRLAEISALKNK